MFFLGACSSQANALTNSWHAQQANYLGLHIGPLGEQQAVQAVGGNFGSSEVTDVQQPHQAGDHSRKRSHVVGDVFGESDQEAVQQDQRQRGCFLVVRAENTRRRKKP